MKMRIVKTVFFEAARRVRRGDSAEPRLTGASYRADLVAEGEIDPAVGWVVDYADMKALFDPVCRRLDHCCLDDIPGLEGDASPERVAAWARERMRPHPAWFKDIRVSIVGDGRFALETLPADPLEGLPERAGFSFAAAQSLPQLPETHPCHRLHGHTYRVEAAADGAAALGDALRELHGTLNDRHINTVPGLEQATCERICAHIWRFLEERGLGPRAVVVQETPNNRCVCLGGAAGDNGT